MDLLIRISPRRTFQVLVLIILGLTAASTIAGAAWYFFDLSDAGFAMVQLFWLDSEANIPTLYASITLLISGLLLGVIAVARGRKNDRYAVHWGVMAFIFVLLGVDEGAAIHERLGNLAQSALSESPLITDTFIGHGPTWIVGGVVFVLLFVAAYTRFLLNLPARTRNLMILSGAVFVTGALGFEILSHMHAVAHGTQETAMYALLATIEEFLEKLGIALFIYTLMSYIASQAGTVTFALEDGTRIRTDADGRVEAARPQKA